MKWLRGTLQELRKYPTAIVGLVVIFALILISAYALITIPYSEAIRLKTPAPSGLTISPAQNWPAPTF
jgi:peptide/nickel transport system permease protein